MLKHVIRVAWNRRSHSILILLEIGFSFVVMFLVMAFATYFWLNSQQPLGFEVEDRLSVSIDRQASSNEQLDDETREALVAQERLILQELRVLPQVEAVSVTKYPPYSGSMSTRQTTVNERVFTHQVFRMSPEHDDVYGVKLLSGRFFEEGDHLLEPRTVLINERFALEAFGTTDAAGEVIDDERMTYKVIGVYDDYKYQGRYEAGVNQMIEPFAVGAREWDRMDRVSLRLKSGTPAQYEEDVLRALVAVQPEWAFNISSAERDQSQYRRSRLAIVTLAGIVLCFLVAMVALGLLGVLWQSVTRRTVEIGVRRAKGATANKIYQQVLGELIVIAIAAMLLATVVIVQLPMIEALNFVDLGVGLRAYAVSAVLMLCFVTVAGTYPSWLASRVQPAFALHYE